VNGADAWADALYALALFPRDTVGFGGIAVRAGFGPVRDRWLALLQAGLAPCMKICRVPSQIGDDALLGGLDPAATLGAGRPIWRQGVLAEADGGVVLLSMAERISSATAARLTAAMDRSELAAQRGGCQASGGARFGLVALDEGIAPDERLPACLLDRLAFHIDLTDVAMGETLPHTARISPLAAAGRQVSDQEARETLCATAMLLGIGSLRPPLLALRVARGAASLATRERIIDADLALAARLVLAPRAACLPPAVDRAPESGREPEPASDEGSPERRPAGERPLEDVVLQAAMAALPPHLLSGLTADVARIVRSRSAGRAGVSLALLGKGRPIGTRPGEPRGGARLDLLETLKAALPWQKLRRRPDRPVTLRIEVRRDDFRIVRVRRRTQTTTVFAVDASGSAALHRLAEAKGAVELLLADCYVRRDQVALICFRGGGASLLLPPTGSLLRARHCLAGLAGGGGTPLAAGIDAAVALADGESRRGRTSVITVLTDGRANISRDGQAGRRQSEADALDSGRKLRAAGHAALLVDTSSRPNLFVRDLADVMCARYVPLPYVDAATLSQAVRSAAA
jgi:magnesium chelatase subunit D